MKMEATVGASGKTERLMELLDSIFTNSDEEKVLIFVSFKAIMYLLEKLIIKQYPSMEALTYSGDNTLQERAVQEQRFKNEPKCRVMVLTIKAGGVGLNLTAASHVIHFDRCYNPAQESQATDRCHRLGQQLQVMEHRLITAGTFEERLEDIMQRKSELSSLTVTGSQNWLTDYSDKELAELFVLQNASKGKRCHEDSPETPPPSASTTGALRPSPDSAPKLPAPGARPGRQGGAASSVKRRRVC